MAFEANGAVSTGPIEQQTKLVLEQIAAILKEAGCTLGDVVKCGCSLQVSQYVPSGLYEVGQLGDQ
ncbi:RidA family protein [Archangium sp.]|uniref:RidA family protein n=1 Tax=Archangium sp. TaxID=1872627 RepID=UPI0039C87265